MDGIKYEDNFFKAFCIPFIKLLLQYVGIEFDTVKIVVPDLVINTSTWLHLDFLVEINGEYLVNIEFMSTKLTEKVKRRFHKYAVHAQERYDMDVITIVISTHATYSHLEHQKLSDMSVFTMYVVSFTHLSIKKTLNEIKLKIENKEKLNRWDMFYFTLVPFMRNEKGIVDSLCKAVEFSEIINIDDEDLWHSIISMHVALVKKFVKDDVLKSRLVDVLNMRDNIIFEKFGRKQFEEGREEGHEEIAIELLKNKDLSLDYISEVTGLSKGRIGTLNSSK
ncbi:MAG: hypothetical protein VZQ49_01580 [Methanobrevibacter sp.]|nr:hypothetical protein [Methanobrevibacter sp.]